MQVIFLYGPPAAGKLTIARELVSRTGYKLMHNHLTFDAVEPVLGAFHPLFAPLLNRLRLDIIRTAVQTDLPGLIVTHVYGPEEAGFIFELQAAAQAHGGQVCFVRLTPHPDELARRVEHPGRHGTKKLQSAAELRRLMANWDVTQEIPGVASLTLNNTSLTPAEAAERIINHYHLPGAGPDPGIGSGLTTSLE